MTELAARADVPVERLRHYAEVGLVLPAHGDGDRYGYPASEAVTVRLLADVEELGITGADLTDVAAAWRSGDCGQARHQLTATVTAHLTAVQHALDEHGRRAAHHG